MHELNLKLDFISDMLKLPKLNNLGYTKFVKSTFYSVISEERKEDWDDDLMERESTKGKKNQVRTWIRAQPPNYLTRLGIL